MVLSPGVNLSNSLFDCRCLPSVWHLRPQRPGSLAPATPHTAEHLNSAPIVAAEAFQHICSLPSRGDPYTCKPMRARGQCQQCCGQQPDCQHCGLSTCKLPCSTLCRWATARLPKSLQCRCCAQPGWTLIKPTAVLLLRIRAERLAAADSAGQEFWQVGLKNCKLDTSAPTNTVFRIPFVVFDTEAPFSNATVDRVIVLTSPCDTGASVWSWHAASAPHELPT